MKEILKTCLEADAIVIGTPIYYGSISSYAQAFLERLLFAGDTYLIDEDGIIVKGFDKVKAADNPAQMLGELE